MWKLLFVVLGVCAGWPLTSSAETIGRVLVDGHEIGRTSELPWRHDTERLSRIQAGSYHGTIRQEGALGWRILLSDVPKHSGVELHMGNFARNTHGCILVGRDVQTIRDPKTGGNACAVVSSAAAISNIQAAMQKASDNGISSQDLAITVTVKD